METNGLDPKTSKFSNDFAFTRLKYIQLRLNTCALQSTGSEGIEQSINATLQVFLLPL